jgi:hypothetical protein
MKTPVLSGPAIRVPLPTLAMLCHQFEGSRRLRRWAPVKGRLTPRACSASQHRFRSAPAVTYRVCRAIVGSLAPSRHTCGPSVSPWSPNAQADNFVSAFSRGYCPATISSFNFSFSFLGRFISVFPNAFSKTSNREPAHKISMLF